MNDHVVYDFEIRFVRWLEFGEIEGVCFGKTYFVKASDYEIAQN